MCENDGVGHFRGSDDDRPDERCAAPAYIDAILVPALTRTELLQQDDARGMLSLLTHVLGIGLGAVRSVGEGTILLDTNDVARIVFLSDAETARRKDQ